MGLCQGCRDHGGGSKRSSGREAQVTTAIGFPCLSSDGALEPDLKKIETYLFVV